MTGPIGGRFALDPAGYWSPVWIAVGCHPVARRHMDSRVCLKNADFEL